jgi:hypothetical protein
LEHATMPESDADLIRRLAGRTDLVSRIVGRDLTDAEGDDQVVSGALLLTVAVRAALMKHKDKPVAKIPWAEVFDALVAVGCDAEVEREARVLAEDGVSPEERLFGQELTAEDLSDLPTWCAALLTPRLVYSMILVLGRVKIDPEALDALRWRPVFEMAREAFGEIEQAGSLAAWRDVQEQEGGEGEG